MLKFPWKLFFARVQSTVFENKRTFMKKAVLHITTITTAKPGKFYALYLVLTKEIAQKGPLWPGTTKVNLKNLKPSYHWMIWCRQLFEFFCAGGDSVFFICHVTSCNPLKVKRRIIWSYACITLTHYPSKFVGKTSCWSGDITFLICHIASWDVIKRHTTLWVRAPDPKSPLRQVW